MPERRFEIVTSYQNQGLTLPKRQTIAAAGYDLAAAQDFVVPSIWKQPLAQFILHKSKSQARDLWQKWVQKALKPVLVPTGIKVSLPEDEVLLLVNRSSGPLNRGLVLPNSVGVIDADYYNNPQNEGEIFVQLLNYYPRDYLIKKGERICQGIFTKYLTTVDDQISQQQRQGGFGSSGK
ncbi:dUTP diphosphatase [Bombilactobacillus folatiphilus]|uniref:dUTP diphosphatase n=1 Tax=Bombilactobacillus folatiphilus TaxID=2923362 RepID=UPI0037C0D5EF